MSNQYEASYTTEEIADLLKVSKLTVYDLIKKGDLRAYRVGRQMRIDAEDLEAYKQKSKSGGSKQNQENVVSKTPNQSTQKNEQPSPPQRFHPIPAEKLIISGQDISLDLLANATRKKWCSLPAASFIYR